MVAPASNFGPVIGECPAIANFEDPQTLVTVADSGGTETKRSRWLRRGGAPVDDQPEGVRVTSIRNFTEQLDPSSAGTRYGHVSPGV